MQVSTTTSNQWIDKSTVLEGTGLYLLPLESVHFQEIIMLGNDERIWASFPKSRSNPAFHHQYLLESMDCMERGNSHAFVIVVKKTGQLAGMTRLVHLSRENRQCEIGSWLGPVFWATGVNTEAKLLVLQYCFETLGMVRVQFRTDVKNERSRRALEKLGATCEGIFRKEKIREDGTTRDAVFYSILDEEWAFVRARLFDKMVSRQMLDSPGAAGSGEGVSGVYGEREREVG